MLGMYGVRMQRIIEKLFMFDQRHLSDLLIKLSIGKKIDQRDRMLDEL